MNSDRRERRLWFGLLAGSAALTLAVYGSALSLPFFFDDFVHIPFVDTHGLGEIWLTAQGLAYYRPLAFTVWKLLALLLGHHDPVAQHAVNLLVHWANGLMVAWLAGRLWSHHRAIVWPRRYLSAALFLLFPFSYQAVPWVGALSHPLVTALILLSLVAYLKFRDASHRGWGAVSLAVTFLAPFAHENGALVGPLMALVEWTQPWRDDSIGRTFLRTAAWALPALVWFPIWRLAPQAVVASAALNSGEALMQNGLYFLQGIAYPVTWLGGWLRAEQSVNDLVAIFVLSTPLFLIAAFVQMRSRDRRAWLPWLWCGLTALPAVAFLKFDYVINGPRLLVLASVGAAWLWTDVALRLVAWSAPAGLLRRMGAAIAAALTLAVLAQNAFFIHDRMLLHDLGGSALRHAIVAAIAANDGGQAAIFINLPAWLAPIRSTFALGHEGVQFLPSYAPDEKIVSVDTGRPAAIRAFRFDEIRPEMPYLYGLRGSTPDWSALAQNGGQVLVTRYAPDAIEVETAGALRVTTSGAAPMAHFGGAVTLFDATATTNGAHTQIDLIWRVDRLPAAEVTVFVHLVDANGQLMAQADGDPLAGAFPFARWAPALIVRDVHTIDASGSGRSVRIGLYSRATGDRLVATSNTGEPFADNAVPILIQSAP